MADRTIKQGDSAPNIENTLTLEGGPVDLTNADTVEYIAYDKFEKEVLRDDNDTGSVSIDDASGGVVTFNVDAGDFPDVGLYEAEWVVNFTDGERISFPNDRYMTIEVIE